MKLNYAHGGNGRPVLVMHGLFGSLSNLDEDEMLRRAKEGGGNPDDPNKRSPLDFVESMTVVTLGSGPGPTWQTW